MWLWHSDRITCRDGQYLLPMQGFHMLWADQVLLTILLGSFGHTSQGSDMCRHNLWLVGYAWQKPITEKQNRTCEGGQNEQSGRARLYLNPSWPSPHRRLMFLGKATALSCCCKAPSERVGHEKESERSRVRTSPLAAAVVMAIGDLGAAGKCQSQPHREAKSHRQKMGWPHNVQCEKWVLPASHLGHMESRAEVPSGKGEMWILWPEGQVWYNDSLKDLWVTGPKGWAFKVRRIYSNHVCGTTKVMTVIGKVWFDLRSEMGLEGKTEITVVK